MHDRKGHAARLIGLLAVLSGGGGVYPRPVQGVPLSCLGTTPVLARVPPPAEPGTGPVIGPGGALEKDLGPRTRGQGTPHPLVNRQRN